MPAQITHQRRKLIVRPPSDQGRNLTLIPQFVLQSLAPGGTAAERQCGIELVWAALDPGAQPFAAELLECRHLQRAMAQHHDVPAEVTKHRFELGPQPLTHDRVQALAVIVHHPPRVAQPVLPPLQKRFEDVALVHLRITDQGDHFTLWPLRPPAFQPQVILHQ